jgi:hypothetical protein
VVTKAGDDLPLGLQHISGKPAREFAEKLRELARVLGLWAGAIETQAERKDDAAQP